MKGLVSLKTAGHRTLEEEEETPQKATPSYLPVKRGNLLATFTVCFCFNKTPNKINLRFHSINNL